jgi:hypothetical protein
MPPGGEDDDVCVAAQKFVSERREALVEALEQCIVSVPLLPSHLGSMILSIRFVLVF